MFDTVLIANRGAIACRIIRTLKKMGIRSVAVYTKADADSLHVQLADVAELIGEGPAADSYLNVEKILAVAEKHHVQAIHPGYGFLSENTGFAAACVARGIAFVGPRAEHITAFGLKHTARELAEQNGIPLSPGTGLLDDIAQAIAAGNTIGYPVMLKSTAGGGGIGMQICHSADDLTDAFDSVQRLSRNNFGNAGLFIEKYIQHARHIEVQIFGDGKGGVLALGERDCSLQRRNQKVIEETPAPDISETVRSALHNTAVRLCAAVNYANAGTVEFIYDAKTEDFYFLEVNTRLQVEHGVTEAVTGIDLVELMLLEAAGELPPLDSFAVTITGHAVQARLYAEDPWRDFQPQSGLLTCVNFPTNLRIDHWIEAGVTVPAFYDPMLAKVIAHAHSREAAFDALHTALCETQVAGIETNRDYLCALLQDETVANAQMTTRYLNDFHWQSFAVDILDGGTHTTVQDVPGRLGYWDIGVPPSGPFDDFSFRLGNRLLGNTDDAAGLEITLNGPTLRFRCDTHIAITGADFPATVNEKPVPLWQTITVKAGDVLVIGRAQDAGARCYLCILGGVQTENYLGSKSTFTLGQFGGHGGRTLRIGDVLHLAKYQTPSEKKILPAAARPSITHQWQLHVMVGPHGAPDFFTPDDVDTFFATAWEVHYNSSRTGVRLIGPKPAWARKDGGEAGLHPSNIHDNAYAIGAVDFTGDMPVILGPDGPSLGGFVCPVTVIAAERWKLGQLRPGDTIRFIPVNEATAEHIASYQQSVLDNLRILDNFRILDSLQEPAPHIIHSERTEAIVKKTIGHSSKNDVIYRAAGDQYLLVEYGPLVLDINLRFRVHALWQWLTEQKVTKNIGGIIDITPGIRSLQVHYDNTRLSRSRLLDILAEGEATLANIHDMVVPSREVWLPLSWDDPATKLAIEKYMQSVNKDAPWCPSNIEFIRRINGLVDEEAVKKIVFDAEYLVMGLGDVYLGAPVATPLDPRHRLVTTKYNPARTWTPENAVGIGGSYMCVYGMEGPGGYQFVGRTLQMWNRWRTTPTFEKPWLLRFFDRIRFYPVSAEELLDIREAFPRGAYDIRIEDGTFNLRDYNHFLTENSASINAFKQTQQTAFEEERERWVQAGQNDFSAPMETDSNTDDTIELLDDEVLISSHVPGSIWLVSVQEGDTVEPDAPLMIVESMKMEMAVTSPKKLCISKLLATVGTQVQPGTALAIAKVVG